MSTRSDRNNNPGNLRPGVGKIIWNGQTGTDADGFATFATRDAGIRAADLNLQAYANRGYNTPWSIISHWSSTDQGAYTTAVAQGLGVGTNSTIDLHNPTVRQNVLAQIFNFEGSGTRYSAGALSDTWTDIQNAVKTGNPLDILSMGAGIGGTIANNVGNVVSDSASTVVDNVGNALHFDLGQWLTNQASGVAKDYLIPIAIGIGAVILIMASSWGLVKDTPVGQAVKGGGKLAARAALV